MSREDGGIQEAFAAVESGEKKAMVGAIKCLYWLCKQDIPHTTKYVPLLDLAKSLGAAYLNDLHLGGNAHYTSNILCRKQSCHWVALSVETVLIC